MKREFVTASVLEVAREIVAAGPICDSCLGGAFGRLGRGLSNEERGRTLRDALSAEERVGIRGTCWVCQDLFADAASWAERARERVAGMEFATYLFAVKPTLRWQETERFFVERFGLHDAEPQKHAWNRSVGKAFERLVGCGTVDFYDPDIKLTIDVGASSLSVAIASVFVGGRYRKLERGIPQTHWPCRRCRGRGCSLCAGTGKQYPESVEELVAGPFVEAFESSGAILHGAGREDIDARMLGSGRPFVLEICGPKKRTAPIGRLEHEVNVRASGKVEVEGMAAVGRDAVRRVKEAAAEKSYRALVEFDGEVSADALSAALRGLTGEIAQRTPRRVAHRRADLVRTRRLHTAAGALRGRREAELEFRTDGGLYVKELVSGDDGRTVPSLSGLLGVGARVVELDVLDVDVGDDVMDGEATGGAMDS